MKVSKIDNQTYPKYISFKAKIALNTQHGFLETRTTNRLNNIFRAYGDILEKLKTKTDEGIEYINKNFPDVTVGQGIAFHNCGEKKTSIMVRKADYYAYDGLTRIIVRRSNTTDGIRKMLDSFMLYLNNMAVTNFDPNRSKQFPDECILATQEELVNSRYDERLNKVLDDLDQAMLKFRIYLNKVSDIYCKKPDGILKMSIRDTLREIDALNKKTKELEKCASRSNQNERAEVLEEELSENNNSKKLRDISHATLYKFKVANAPNNIRKSGLRTYKFQDLGPDNLTIQCGELESGIEPDLMKMTIWNKDGDTIAGYIFKNGEKVVNNLLHKNPHLRKELTYMNADEIVDYEFNKKLQEYLDLYKKAITDYKIKLEAKLEFQEAKPPGEIPTTVQNNVEECCTLVEELFKNHNFHKPSLFKKLSECGVVCVSDGMRSGIMFNDYLSGAKTVQFMPLNTRHENLIKLSMIDNEKSYKTHRYLVKDFKYIVKNYNQTYHQTIPAKLTYYTEDELAENRIRIDYVMDYLVNKLREVKKIVDNAEPSVKPAAKKQTEKQPIREHVYQMRPNAGKIWKTKEERSIEEVIAGYEKEAKKLSIKNPEMNSCYSIKDRDDYHNFLLSINEYNRHNIKALDKSFDEVKKWTVRYVKTLLDYYIQCHKD